MVSIISSHSTCISRCDVQYIWSITTKGLFTYNDIKDREGGYLKIYLYDNIAGQC